MASNSHASQMAGAKNNPNGTAVTPVTRWPRSAAIKTAASADTAAISMAIATAIQLSQNSGDAGKFDIAKPDALAAAKPSIRRAKGEERHGEHDAAQQRAGKRRQRRKRSIDRCRHHA